MCSRVLPFLFCGALLGGCASDPGPKPEDQRDAALTAVEAADEAGAEDAEPAVFQAAREKLKSAEALIEEKRYSKARVMLEQAEVDARLAEARARTQEVRNELGDLKVSIESLR
ncbi:MAG: DUF4398 domain-containing protein, partial [Marinobacter sp.]